MNKINKWNALVFNFSPLLCRIWHQTRVYDAPPPTHTQPASSLRTSSTAGFGIYLRIWAEFDPDSFFFSSICGPFEAAFVPLRCTSVILGVCLSTGFGFTLRARTDSSVWDALTEQSSGRCLICWVHLRLPPEPDLLISRGLIFAVGVFRIVSSDK